MARAGRKPTGAKLLDKLHASPRAMDRMRAIVETLSGQKTIPEVCAELGIGEAMFHRIRDQALQAGLAALEAKPMGRPPVVTTVDVSRVMELERHNQELELELRTAELRTEIAQTMPHLQKRPAARKKK